MRSHFHVPSEHVVDGARAAIEIHFVHQAAGGAGRARHVGRRNAAFGRLLASLPYASGTDLRVEDPVDSEDLRPASRHAYRYSGSRTTRPCAEPIRQLVLARPLAASKSQLDALDGVADGNGRPLQPANGRSLILF